MNNMKTQTLEELLEEYRKNFCTEEELLCECGHSEGNHYWNGAGNPDRSGYDRCLADGCDCVYDENKIKIKEVLYRNINAEAFIKKVYAAGGEAGKKEGAKEFINSLFPIDDEGEVLESIDDSQPGDGFFIWVDSIKRELNKFINHK